MFTPKFFATTFLLTSFALFAHLLTAQEPTARNIDAIIADALKAGEKQIKIPAGQYRLGAKGGAILSFENLDGVTVDATDAELVCLNTTKAIDIKKCKNFTLKGLSIDYDPLPYTQGKITSISDDGTEWNVEIFDGYPSASSVRDFKLEVYNPQTSRLRTWDIYNFETTPVSDKIFKVKINGKRRAELRQERVGDYIVIGSSNISREAAHAVMLSDCENVRLENVSLYASNCFGFFEANCKSTVYEKCRLDKRPLEKDIVKRAVPRLRSANADGYHSKFSKSGPSYIDCVAMWNGDDSIAINGKYFLLLSSNKNQIKIASVGGAEFNIEKGDTVEIFSTDGKVCYAKVLGASQVELPESGERDWIVADIVKRTILGNRKFDAEKIRVCNIEIDENLENLSRGGLVCAANKIGEGFKIIGGEYGNNRSRGLIVKSGMGLIKGVKITGARMAAILCAPEAFWFEAGHSRNLTIEDCQIECGMNEAIRIESQPMFSHEYSPSGAHKNIVIRNNKIKYYYPPSMLLASIENLWISGNKTEIQDAPSYEQFSKSERAKSGDGFKIVNCAQSQPAQ